MLVPELQGQSWRKQVVSNPAHLCRVSPDQLDYCHMSQVQATLSLLFSQDTDTQIHQFYVFDYVQRHSKTMLSLCMCFPHVRMTTLF